jgi:hypothetical protein
MLLTVAVAPPGESRGTSRRAAAAEWLTGGRGMAGQFGRVQRWLLAAWGVPFLCFFVYVFIVPAPRLQEGAKPREALRVYSNTGYYRALDKPVDFGLEKLTSVVNYLLLASAAVLGFLTKALTEFRSELAKPEAVPEGVRPGRPQLLLYLHAGIACFFSLTWGVLAYLTLPDITAVETFAVTGFLSRCVTGQIAGLLFAALLVLVALGGVVRRLLP